MKFRALLPATLIALATLPCAFAQADKYPSRPVQIIVPSVPGGLLDLSARLIGTKLSSYWGVPVIVENRPGASMSIGTNAVAKAAPDGYTLLMGYDGSVIGNPLLSKDTPYTTKDLEPVAQVYETSLTLITSKDVPATNFKELDAYVRRNPSKLNYPIADNFSGLMSEMLRQATGWNYVDVMYKGSAERIRSVMSGETQLTMVNAADAAAAMQSGRVRALAVTSLERSPKMPELGTLDELGVKGFSLSSWGGMFAPARTSLALVQKINADVNRALAEPDVAEGIQKGGSFVRRLDVKQFQALVERDTERWAGLVQRSAAKREGNP